MAKTTSGRSLVTLVSSLHNDNSEDSEVCHALVIPHKTPTTMCQVARNKIADIINPHATCTEHMRLVDRPLEPPHKLGTISPERTLPSKDALDREVQVVMGHHNV